MTTLARTERTALCDTALEVGADRPTLCGDWDVEHLVIHLLMREGSLASIGTFVPPLAGFARRATHRLEERAFPELVERLRGGPPRLSPFALPKLDELGNGLELFVHHEDIRRAQPSWSPRTMDEAAEQTLWSSIRIPAKLLARKAPDGVGAENSLTGQRHRLKKGEPVVTVRGRPGEVALFLFGRSGAAQVELVGDDDAVARLRTTSFSV